MMEGFAGKRNARDDSVDIPQGHSNERQEIEVFIIDWKGTLPQHLFNIDQQGYVSAEAETVRYPDGLERIDCGLGTNPTGMPAAVRAELERLSTCALCDYPAPEPEDLKKGIAATYPCWQVKPEQILPGAGSMGVLVTLLRLLLRPGSVLAGPSPQFTDTILQALFNEASYAPVPLSPPVFRLTADPLLEAVEKAPTLLYLDRPHNPTGQVLPLEDVDRLARRGMEKGVWILSDEAYGDFLPPEESACRLPHPNLVTCRSFSKGLGGAGLRVGYAVTRNEELATLFRRIQPPFAVGTLDAALALAALEDTSFLEKTRRYVRYAKERTLEALRTKAEWTVAETDLRVPIFFLSQESGDLVRRLAAGGILCEAGSGYVGLDNRRARLRVPSPDKLELFLERMGTI